MMATNIIIIIMFCALFWTIELSTSYEEEEEKECMQCNCILEEFIRRLEEIISCSDYDLNKFLEDVKDAAMCSGLFH